MTLPAGMSLLDYLWTTFSELKVDNLITNESIKEYLKNYLIDIEILPDSVILYNADGGTKTIPIEKEDHLVNIKPILSTQVEIDNGVCEELDIPLIEFTMKSGEKYYIRILYDGVETNTIKTIIKDGRIASHLKIDDSSEVIKTTSSENGVKVDLSIKESDKQIKLEKTLDGLDVKYTWEDGNEIEFKATTYDLYSLTQPKSGTIYFIKDMNCMYLNGIKYGQRSIPVVSETNDGLMSKEDKEALDNIPNEFATKEEVLKSITNTKTELCNYFEILLKNYALKSDNELAAMIKEGGDITIISDINSTKGYTLTKNSTIDLNGHTLDAESNGNYGDNVVIGNGANITINNGTINPALKATESNASAAIIVKTAYASTLTLNDCKVTGIYPLYVNSANKDTLVTINGGEFYTTSNSSNPDNMPPAVYVGKGSTGSTIGGKVIINSGTFGKKGVVNNYLLNVEDVLRKQEGKDSRNFIEVFGGTFINFDPSNNKAEGEGTNFVAEGHTVETIQDGDDIIYKVI